MVREGSQSVIDQAIILAAGLGTRMRPLTDHTPKPLLKVGGIALIDYKLDAARRVGIQKVVVNTHHLADQIESHLHKISDIEIIISDERDKLMDSGGGIAKALHHFNGKPFVVLNSDTFWHGDNPPNLSSLISRWNEVDMDILMGLAQMDNAVGFHGAGDFFLDDSGHLIRRGDASHAPYVFCGDYITRPDVFVNSPDKPFSSNTLFDQAIAKRRLFGLPLNGLWLHVGTPDAIGDAERAIALSPS